MSPEEWAAVRGRLGEFAAEMFAPLARSDQRAKGQTYVRGLLLDGRRKSMQPMAERLGVDHQGWQQFVSSSSWAVEPVRERLARRAVTVIDPDAWVVEDTGFVKDGTASPGVARQYSGTLGRVDNCQIGTFLAYVNSGGDRVLIDRELYIPKESWFDQPYRCAEAGVPVDLEFATRPQQVAAMIERTVAAGVPFAWFAADEEFGQNPGLREHLEGAGISYVMAIPKNTQFTDAGGHSATIEDSAATVRPNDWTRRACGIGAKGYRIYDWAVIGSADTDHQYLVRRSIDDAELAFYH